MLETERALSSDMVMKRGPLASRKLQWGLELFRFLNTAIKHLKKLI